jgi:tetratricopeptide (TPR) repeat protein
MMPSIDKSFHSIVAALKRLRRPAARLLQPGKSDAAIAEVAALLPFKLTKELVELFRTTNGTDAKQGSTLDDLSFFPGYYLLSLEDAVSEYRKVKRERQWKKGWFPFFANGAGDYYVVSCEPATQGVIGFLRGEPDQPVEYASVTAMFATLAKCFEEGAFYTKKREFEIDDDKHRHIAMSLNPGVALWEQEAAEEAEAARDAEAAAMAVEASKFVLKKRNALEALALFEKALAVPDQQGFAYVNALCAVTLAAEQGLKVEPERIRRLLDVCLAQKDLHGDGHFNAALCFMILGEPDRAIASLKQAKRKGLKLKAHLADPLLVPLTTDKRFMALVKASN